MIQREELACVLRAVAPKDLGPVDMIVAEIFDKFDTDHNDGIDIDEFINAARERPDLQKLFVLEVPVFNRDTKH
jgi:Ca2+-binding EF-hand superfamily protein